MGRELYQLVAIDKNNNQYVVELNNENKKNKGSLEFIDYGTVHFANEQHLAEYLHKKGTIPTTNVNFFIKYKHNGDKMLPVIYNDRDLYIYLGVDEAGRYNEILRFFSLIQIEFEKLNFYNFFLKQNKYNSNQINNGNCLNNKLFFDLIQYYDTYIKNKNYGEGKVDLQYSILTELSKYKQFRTMHHFYQSYIEINKAKEDMAAEQEFLNTNNNIEYEKLVDIPDDIRHAYETNGMDDVYSIVDLDDLVAKGIANLDELGLNDRRIR